ncbi:MAG: hypothetical protein WDZ93_01165 [Candidatus Paceibacterota bacterium]
MHILVIEGDELLRDGIAKALRRIRHDVEEASNFDEAESILFDRLGSFDLIVCAENVPDSFERAPGTLARMRELSRLRPQLQFRILRDSPQVPWFKSVLRQPGAPKVTRYELIDSLLVEELT